MATSRWVGLAKEVTTGTYVSPTRYVGIDSDTVEPKPITTFVVRSGFSQPIAAHGYGIPETGDIMLKAARSADILHFVRGFMGLEAYTFTADTPVVGVGRHVWTDFNNKPLDGSAGGTTATESVTINYDVNQMRYPGCWFNSLALRQTLGQPLEFTWGVIGSTTLATRVAADNTQVTPTGRGFGHFDPTIPSWQIKLAGTDISTLIKGFDLRIERSYDANLFTADSQQTKAFQTPGATTITGTLMTDKTDAYAATNIITDLMTRGEDTLEVIWASDIITGATREKIDLLLTNIVFKGGIPHMQAARTPPGYAGNFTFEAYRNAAPSLTIFGENTTIA